MSDQQLIHHVPPADHDAQPSESGVAAANRRRHERYETVKPLVVIPVLPDGALDWERRTAGFTVNVSEGGLGIEVDQSAAGLPSSLLVGVEDDDGKTHFAGVNVRYRKQGMSRGTSLGAAFGGPGEQVLGDGKLRPQFNAETLSLEYPLPQNMLDKWVEAGVLMRTLCDRVQLCPQCRSLPTFRSGCRKCYSARVTQDQLIHHFACAHVDQATNFHKSGELVCPKCRTARMVVGADFEYLNGQHQCLDCQWQDTTLESIAHCLRCNHRFAADEAHVLDVYTYSANRLTWRQMIHSRRQRE